MPYEDGVQGSHLFQKGEKKTFITYLKEHEVA